MTTQTPPSWHHVQEQARAAGLTDPEALDALRKLTAPARHAWRVVETRRAAEAEIARIELSVPGDDMHEPIVAALLTLDLHGLGGPANCGGSGSGTTRCAWARGLGSGRWFARDGGAYRGAVEHILACLDGWPLTALGRYVVVDGGHAKLRGVGMLAVYLLCRASLTDESVLAAARGYALHRMADEVGGEREVIENVRFAADIPLSWAGVAQAAAEGLARHQVAREEREERLRAEEAERAEDDARAHEHEMAAIDGAREERLRAEEEARLQLASSSSS